MFEFINQIALNCQNADYAVKAEWRTFYEGNQKKAQILPMWWCDDRHELVYRTNL